MEQFTRSNTRKNTRRKSEFFCGARSTTLYTPRHVSIKEEENLLSTNLFENLSQIIDPEKATIESIQDTFVSLVKSFTHSNWVELLLLEDNALRVCGRKQSMPTLIIDETTSLPGLTASKQEPMLITNSHTSVFYAQFPIKLAAYSTLTKTATKPTSTACIPLFDIDQKLFGVTQLFNKQERTNSTNMFTNEDVNTVQSIGRLFGEILRSRNRYFDVKFDYSQSVSFLSDQIDLFKTVNHITRRKRLLSEIQYILEANSTVNSSIIKLTGDIMDSISTVLLLNNSGNLQNFISSGEKLDLESVEKFSEYRIISYNEIINIRDLQSEPLCSKKISSLYKNCLICPIKSPRNEKIGALYFFREIQEFKKIDEQFGEEICKMLGNVSIQNFIDKTKFIENPRASEEVKGLIDSFYHYTLKKTGNLFDYGEMIREIKRKICKTIQVDSCSVYIADQHEKSLWTTSEFSDIIEVPRSQETLLWNAYDLRSTIHLPNEEFDHLDDIDIYKDKDTLCTAILGENLKDPVTGVLLITRENPPFSKDEIWMLEKFTMGLGRIFDSLFMQFLPDWPYIVSEPKSAGFLMKSPPTFFEKSKLKIKSDFHRSGSIPLSRGRMESFEGLELKSKNNKKRLVKNITTAISMPLEKLEVLKNSLLSIEYSEEPLKDFTESLSKIVNCKQSSLYLYDNFRNQILDFYRKFPLTPKGLVKKCIDDRNTVYISSKAFQNIDFSLDIDAYHSNSPVDSILVVPVMHVSGNILGVITFINFDHELPEEEISSIKSLAFILWEISLCTDKDSNNWKSVVEDYRKMTMFKQWYKQIYSVSNNTFQKLAFCKDVAFKVVTQEKFENLLQTAFDVINAVTNAEKCTIIYKDYDGYFEFSKELSFTANQYTDQEISFYSKIFKDGVIVKSQPNSNSFSIIYVPILYNTECIAMLRVINKKDATLRSYVDFTPQDEQFLSEFVKSLSNPLKDTSSPSNESLKQLTQTICQVAANYKNNSTLITIRTAAQHLFDCELSVIYSLKGSKLTVRPQGLEHEAPEGHSLEIGQGIAGFVALNRKTEIIESVYSDKRFDPKIDKLSGYKTSNMICMPLIDSYGKVIGVLQLINKRSGLFSEKEIPALEDFAEIMIAFIQNGELIRRIIEEKSTLLEISNSIADNILVINNEEKLYYTNKPIEPIFGISEGEVAKLSYFAWLHGNRQLIEDIETVMHNPEQKIRKTSQKIKKSGRKISSFQTENEGKNTNKTFNYRIMQLQSSNTDYLTGVVVILEDASALEALQSEFKEVQNHLRSMAVPFNTETQLQVCISELNFISSNVGNEHISEQIQEIIGRLKAGGLTKPKAPNLSDKLRSILNMTTADQFEKDNSPLHEFTFTMPTQDKIVPLEVLRNWNLNAFQVDNELNWIYTMFHDFSLLATFKIEENTLFSFISSLKDICEQRKNPFHNFYHCFNVMHATYMLLSITPAGGYFEANDILALLVAGICHDLDHTGRTNMYEVNSRSEFSLLYHDKSVLEQHHAAVAFQTLQDDKNNILKAISRENYMNIRKMIITAILGTDMSKHISMISNMTARFNDLLINPIGKVAKDKEKLGQLILHCADLAHPTKPYRIYEMWSMLVCQEFSDQYAEEERRGLPLSVFMKDLDKPQVYYSNEIGFLNYVVVPVWKCLNLLVQPSIDFVLEGLENNIVTMKQKLEDWKEAEG